MRFIKYDPVRGQNVLFIELDRAIAMVMFITLGVFSYTDLRSASVEEVAQSYVFLFWPVLLVIGGLVGLVGICQRSPAMNSASAGLLAGSMLLFAYSVFVFNGVRGASAALSILMLVTLLFSAARGATYRVEAGNAAADMIAGRLRGVPYE